MNEKPAISAQEAPDRACPVCGLTAAGLRDTGRMGCARCYDVFADMVAQAAKELHGQDAKLPAAATPPPPTPDRDDSSLPWPTRRAATVMPAAPPVPPAPARHKR